MENNSQNDIKYHKVVAGGFILEGFDGDDDHGEKILIFNNYSTYTRILQNNLLMET